MSCISLRDQFRNTETNIIDIVESERKQAIFDIDNTRGVVEGCLNCDLKKDIGG